MDRDRIVVGISGGVDSSVAALLLKEQGHDVHAVFMKNWEDTYEPGYCTAAEDLRDAEDVCARLGIPLHRVDFTAEYRQRVFEHFLAEQAAGRTPNADVLCNSEIKFKAFLDHARALGADRIATGHYARRTGEGREATLEKAADAGKDQTYFLHGLDREQLASAVFPLGGLHKREVRTIAHEAGLVTYDKKDSTGICFIGERDFRAFLSQFFDDTPGPMVSAEGELVGQHRGLAFYTIGQRQGLGIGGRRDGNDAPWYVVDKDMAGNRLIVAQGNDHPALFAAALETAAPHWIGEAPALPLPLGVKIRYRQPDQACTVSAAPGGGLRVVFDQPQRAVTPGQYAVFYDGPRCLGGAVILHPLPQKH